MERSPRAIKEIPRSRPGRALARFLLACGCGFLPLGSAPLLAEEPDRVTVVWAKDILLGTEFTGSSSRRVPSIRRWSHSPSLAVRTGTAAQRDLVREVVADLNLALLGSSIDGIRSFAQNAPHADIEVFFIPLSEFDREARRRGFRAVKDNYGMFWVTWDAARRLEGATVFLASDRLDGDKLRHFAFEEITQALGLMNDSEHYRDSIFSSRNYRKNDPAQLTVRDAALVRLLYRHLKPGDKAAKIETAMERHWNSVHGELK